MANNVIRTPYMLSVVDGKPFTPDPDAFGGVLDFIAENEWFTAVTHLNTHGSGQIGYCPCPNGHDGLPITYIDSREMGGIRSRNWTFHYCDFPASSH